MSRDPAGALIRGDEILEQALAYVGKLQSVIEERRDETPGDERLTMLLDVFASQQRELHQALARFIEDSSPHTLAIRLPLSEPPPETPPPLPEPLPVEEATRWLMEANQRLVTLFADMAAKSRHEELTRQLEDLKERVRQHDLRIAKEANRFGDL